MPQPAGVSISVECYFLRGLEFRPEDPVPLKFYGTYLARISRLAEALRRFEDAEKFAPDDSILLYNMGLVSVDLGDYERARSYAVKAYGAGIELPGLREKLIKAGCWRECESRKGVIFGHDPNYLALGRRRYNFRLNTSLIALSPAPDRRTCA